MLSEHWPKQEEAKHVTKENCYNRNPAFQWRAKSATRPNGWNLNWMIMLIIICDNGTGALLTSSKDVSFRRYRHWNYTQMTETLAMMPTLTFVLNEVPEIMSGSWEVETWFRKFCKLPSADNRKIFYSYQHCYNDSLGSGRIEIWVKPKGDLFTMVARFRSCETRPALL